jgi:hypothetical protein
MITEMKDILGKLDRVTATIYPADTEGRHRVTLSCKVKESEGPETKHLESFAPLSLFGTPEELDEKLGGVVASWSGCLSTSFDNLKEIDDMAKAQVQASKNKTKKETPAAKKKRETKEARDAQLKKDKEEEDKKLEALGMSGKQRFGSPTEPVKEPVKESVKSDNLLEGLLA